jgi:hypothetical protein
VRVGIAPNLSHAGVRVLGQSIAAAGVPVQMCVELGQWVAMTG